MERLKGKDQQNNQIQILKPQGQALKIVQRAKSSERSRQKFHRNNQDTIKYEDVLEEHRMMQMNFEGGDRDKRKMDDGDMSEDYDYGQELD